MSELEVQVPLPTREEIETHREQEAVRAFRTAVKYALTQLSNEKVREIVKQETYDYPGRT